MARLLSPGERAKALKRVPEWQEDEEGKAIARTFTFADFSAAFGFMARVALAADKMDHHPDWSNSYDTVAVKLSTHSAGGITELDVALATEIDRIAGG